MQCKPEQLLSILQKASHPMIWLSGDDPLLMSEAAIEVRAWAREKGFSEREIFEVGNGFDWNSLTACGNDLSLFADRKLIDLRLNNAKLDEKARLALQEYLANPNPDNLLLFTSPKIEKAAQNTKWFKSLESQAVFCQLWAPTTSQFPQWLRQRLRKVGLDADNEALQLLCERVEGNLLAAVQEVEKLSILATTDQLDAATIMNMVADSSRYNVFSLTEACLSGQSDRALRILSHLEAEGEECLGLTFMLTRELRSLATMSEAIDAGHNVNAVLQQHRVWSSRLGMMTSALRRHNSRTLQKLLKIAMHVDHAVKGLNTHNPWDELQKLVLGISNPRLLVGMV
jgi:DNA polymerase-3 subunit delta